MKKEKAENLSARKTESEEAQNALAAAKQALSNAKSTLSDAETAKGSRSIIIPAEPTGRVLTVAPVATGDTAELMETLAELLAGAGLMALVFRTKKDTDDPRAV